MWIKGKRPAHITAKRVIASAERLTAVLQCCRKRNSTAEINVPSGGAEGVIYASGAHTGGYTLFVKDDKLHFAYNYLARKMFRIDATDKLSDGDHTIVYEFEVTGKGDHQKGEGNPGTGTLVLDGKKVGSVDMDVTVPFIFSIEGISVGHDYGDSVDHANYQPTYPFTGTVKSVKFDISGDAVKNAEAQTRKAMSHQ